MNKLIALLFSVLLSSSCFAGGMPVFTGGLVFDPTNFAQNMVKAAQTAERVVTQAQQYATQIQQYRMAVQQLQSLDPKQLAALGGVTYTDLQAVNNYIGSLKNVMGDLSNVSDALNRRFTEAQLSGRSWQDYLVSQQDAVKANVKSAQIRAQNEAALLKSVQDDYAMAAQWQSRIPATFGTNEDVQLLNAQMNRIVMQNAQVMKLLVDQNGALKAGAKIDELAKRKQDAESRSIFYNAIHQDGQNTRSLVDGLR
ncbi:conjugal transfer protein [Ralstonia insidiosa]|nr:conjugal transfer protein [Ralstonia insidiosa]MBA9939808.1 conjugal transfer protein [Ralstonia insidiosa]MBC9968475.1 conjugal transfer protein [Ralstonia insidiosa]MBX3904704.1 conjugal transfer protein [Ralstonia insidiosa]